MMNEEIWIEIQGYEGKYAISNKRRIKSLKRLSNDGRLLREREMKFSKNGNYDVVQLVDDEGKYKIHYVDKLMFIHFGV